jgi:hypothetical protein
MATLKRIEKYNADRTPIIHATGTMVEMERERDMLLHPNNIIHYALIACAIFDDEGKIVPNSVFHSTIVHQYKDDAF